METATWIIAIANVFMAVGTWALVYIGLKNITSMRMSLTKMEWKMAPKPFALHTSLTQLIGDMVNESRQQNIWNTGTFAEIKGLSSDAIGDLGEKFIEDNLRALGYTVERPSNLDRIKMHWDIKVKDVKMEIKTATIGRDGRNFQHENIEKRDYDVLVLLDITPESIYLTVAPRETLPFDNANNIWTKNPKKMHRRAHGILYKWDLNLADVENRKVETLLDIQSMFSKVLV